MAWRREGLLEPVIRPRGGFALLREQSPDGRRAPKTLARQLDITLEELRAAVIAAGRESAAQERPIVHFEGQRQAAGFSVRRALAGKHVMLIGVTGFIGKVWLANTLMELPKIGRIYLLIRRQKSNPAQRRFEKIVEESPVFDPLFENYGAGSWRISAGQSRGGGGRRHAGGVGVECGCGAAAAEKS